ncbi:lectin subunit alpha-like [Culex pipiens pallens]|uniref:lectin subunit alpha-like n=1 Tax=Culex pipiens pallens TaxID=42434 RepID=UPI0019545E2C|nr:lectin subunit alpha-like [Culex pipiens pallens]
MKFKIQLILFVSLFLAINCQKEAVVGRYHFFQGYKVNWIGAVEACNRRNLTIVSIESEEKQKDLEHAGDQAPEGPHWIGGSNLSSRKDYVWLPSGEPFSFTNWHPGQPNNRGNCVIYWNFPSSIPVGHWFAYDCNKSYDAFICEEKPVLN